MWITPMIIVELWIFYTSMEFVPRPVPWWYLPIVMTLMILVYVLFMSLQFRRK